MKLRKVTALILLLPMLLASCSGKIKGNPGKEELLTNGTLHPAGTEDPYINYVVSVCSSDEDNEYDPPAAGTHINVRCSASRIDPEDEPEITMYVFPYNGNYVWDPQDAVAVCTGERTEPGVIIQDGDIVQAIILNPLLFSFDLPEDISTGDYTFVFVYDGNKVDSMYTCTLVGDLSESSVVNPSEPGDTSFIFWPNYPPNVKKPVIYLYPEDETEMYVNVQFDGEFTCTYPQRNDQYGWHITATPDGKIYNIDDGRYYDYLFWEGTGEVPAGFEHAACVRGCDTAAFLEEYLEAAGLRSSEIDDFISFWLPLMQDNAYNLISFPQDEYEEMAQLDLSVTPDTVIRVYMVFTALDEEIDIPSGQELVMPSGVARDGFTVVEWGGSQV